MQRFTRTGSGAGRLFAPGEPVDAQITFLHDTILAGLGQTKGTSLGAGFTTATFVSINDHDAILCSLGAGFGWTRIRAARFAIVQLVSAGQMPSALGCDLALRVHSDNICGTTSDTYPTAIAQPGVNSLNSHYVCLLKISMTLQNLLFIQNQQKCICSQEHTGDTPKINDRVPKGLRYNAPNHCPEPDAQIHSGKEG